ncbi:glutamate synthase-related protein [Candidatus Latescibacterota bacterium]
MPEKYHIETKPVLPRRPRIGKYGVMDWREDCARCKNCAKDACIYDRHSQEMDYIRNLSELDALIFDCRGCFSCIQQCTKNLLGMSINPAYEHLGNSYWTPDIIRTTWLQAETGKIPVSGAGYGGPFSGPGFDSMWTDMSEIVRPTRDGIHGREYISTSVDIGRKTTHLTFDRGNISAELPPLVTLPVPVMFDMIPSGYGLPKLDKMKAEAAVSTGLMTILDSQDWPLENSDSERYLPHIALCLSPGSPIPSREVLKKIRFIELPDDNLVSERIHELKDINPDVVISVRVMLGPDGVERAVKLGLEEVEVVHVRADQNGNEVGATKPRFIKDMIREIHTTLVESGKRDEMTLIAGGGIALPEHMAKAIICGADLVSIDLPLLIGLECHLCDRCSPGHKCPAKIEEVDFEYGVGRMTNLMAAWHGQLIEVMGAMGMREVRRLRGDTGRALFFEELEEETFGRLFGSRNNA